MDTEKAKKFVIEADTLYEDIVFGVFDTRKYERMVREYRDVDCYGILREMHALTSVRIGGRQWKRTRTRIDEKAIRFQALCERVIKDGLRT